MADEGTDQQPQERGFPAVVARIKGDTLNFVLWISRFLTIAFALGYLLPIFGSSLNSYNKMLMSNALTSALRLYQRVPISSLRLDRATLNRVLHEDACHYLMYTMIFMSVKPVFLLVIPVTVFAFLHFMSYLIQILDLFGQNSCWPARLAISVVEFQSSNLLRLIAFTEICIAPLCLILMFTGRSGLLTPFLYAQFLMLRYSSLRNPHTRNMFYRLRLMTESFANKPSCPGMVANLIHKAIALLSRMSPPMEAQQQQQRQQ